MYGCNDDDDGDGGEQRGMHVARACAASRHQCANDDSNCASWGIPVCKSKMVVYKEGSFESEVGAAKGCTVLTRGEHLGNTGTLGRCYADRDRSSCDGVHVGRTHQTQVSMSSPSAPSPSSSSYSSPSPPSYPSPSSSSLSEPLPSDSPSLPGS